MTPLLTVMILNWNANHYLKGCLESVFHSDYPALEVIVIDNASIDNSKKQLAYYNIKTIFNKKNLGTAKAFNQASKSAIGKYISFLASDTKVDELYFKRLVRTLELDPSIGIASGKVLYMDDKRIDSVGEFMTQWGILHQRHGGFERQINLFDKQVDIFSAKGTNIIIRKQLFDKLKFDEDYFMFLDETDLCWRTWLEGYRVVYVPKAVMYHAVSYSIDQVPRKEYFVHYLGTKNYIQTFIKNISPRKFFRRLVVFVGMWCGIMFASYAKLKWVVGTAILNGILWNIIYFPKTYAKRKFSANKRYFPVKKVELKELFLKAKKW